MAERAPGRLGPPLLVLTAILSVQFGGALAATLLPRVGVLGSVTLRLVIAAAILLVAARPRLRGRSRADWGVVIGFGASLALMNAAFYGSLTRLPIGVAVTIEFLGPLALAAITSRRLRDMAAVAAALLGVLLISQAVTTPWDTLDLLGIGLALAAGACWAWYILASSATGQRFVDLDGVALAMAVAALMVLPFGLLDGGTRLAEPGVLWRGAGVAILSSALPYSLELVALRRLPTSVFGVLMSLEPAVAALAGLVVLGQRLAADQLLGMSLVILASVLVLRASARDPGTP